jgi:putative tricarboxylic transport membrane protein
MGLVILFEELIASFRWDILLALFGSVSLGVVIGALPGLSATIGIALLSGLTYNFPTELAIPILIGIYVGAIYGGSISAVLINIPGTGASAATALDGFPLARRGEALKALYLTRFASFLGTIFGIMVLISFTPLISRLAERSFASPEFFLLAIFGIIICGSLTSEDKPIKGWIAGMIGLMLSFIGLEEIYGYQRFTFGQPQLLNGIEFIPVMIGIFGIPQIITTLKTKPDILHSAAQQTKKKMGLAKELVKNWWNILRSGMIGVGVGAVPGVGEDIASWMSYDRAKKSSKEPEKFGKGSYEGIIASETANNACIGGAIIPLLTLAVPGSAPAAVLLGAMYLHGIRPGPMLNLEFPRFTYQMSAILLIAALALLICGLLLSGVMARVLKVKPAILLPLVGALCVVGSYVISINTFDIYLMFIAGLIGFVLFQMGYPPAPLILGLILGPLADSNLRRTLLESDGSLLPFFTRPISLIFVLLILFSILSQMKWWKRLWSRKHPS